jgi:hypothetical protein
MSTIATGVKADRASVILGAGEEKVTIANSLPGAVSLALDQKDYQGIDVKLDKNELKSGEKAVVTVRAKAAGNRPRIMVGVLVKPTNQLIQFEVK